MAEQKTGWRVRFWPRFGQLQLGLCLFGLGIALMLEARIGLDPWSTFHSGLAEQLALSFGRITQSVGLFLIVVAALLLKERPGIGTLFNMALIGPWIDLFRDQSWFPAAQGWSWGIGQFMGGVALMGLASGLYIGARFGAGPRDAFVLGLSRRLGISIRVTRIGLEIIVLAIGWLLGGIIGLGTVLFALSMGPLMQASLRLFGYSAPQRSRDQPRLSAGGVLGAHAEPLLVQPLSSDHAGPEVQGANGERDGDAVGIEGFLEGDDGLGACAQERDLV